MHSIIRFLIVILAPIGLIAGGAAIFGYAMDNEYRTLVWIGAGLFVAGLVWGAILYLFSSGGSFFD
ncbi:MAG: hypothetical protein AAF557_22725 [Pseudomonadota bacterium]